MHGTPPPPAPRPRAIRNQPADGSIAVEWNDGLTQTIPWTRLRWRCPCAVCQGEMGQPGRLAFVTALTDEEMTLESLHGIGNYGVAARWKDGHDTGIYPWPLLRQIGDEPTEAGSP